MPLNQEQKDQLTSLLKEADTKDFRGPVWHELVKKFITTPIELFVLDKNDRIFLVRRSKDDKEFVGRPYHHPGTVINDWESYEVALKRLIAGELMKDAGLTGITHPEPFGFIEGPRGDGPNGNVTRHSISTLCLARFNGEYESNDERGFFSINALPEGTLQCHRYYIENYLKVFLKTGKPIMMK